MSTYFNARISIPIVAILILGSLIRCAHLFTDHYYVISADSYYFHYQARLIMDGENLPALHSGIAHPVGTLASITSLYAASVIVPLGISAVISLVIFLFASRYFGTMAGLCSALAWAMLPQAYFITGAGYLDRDGFSMLLFSLAIVLCLYIGWQIPRIRRIPVGWILSGIIAVAMGQVIEYEWSWAGRWLLMAVIVGIFSGELLGRILKARDLPWPRRISGSIASGPWPALVIILASLAIMDTDLSGHAGDAIDMANQSHFDAPIGETTRLHWLDVALWYHPVLLMIGSFGAWIMFKRGSRQDLAVITWFFVLVVLAFGSKRCAVPALPALAVIIGVGLAPVLTVAWRVFRECFHDWRQICFVALVPIVLVGGLFWNAYNQGTIDRISPDPEWQRAMYVLDNMTPEDARILSFGDYGYWIRDIGDRFPLAYGSPESNIKVVSQAYCAESSQELADVMEMAGADYFVFCIADYTTNIFDVIVESCSDGEDPESARSGAYAWRVMTREVITDDPLYLVYINGKVGILSRHNAFDSLTLTPSITARR